MSFIKVHQSFSNVEVRLEGFNSDCPYIYGQDMSGNYTYRYMSFSPLKHHVIDFTDLPYSSRIRSEFRTGSTLNNIKVFIVVDKIYHVTDSFGGMFTLIVGGHQRVTGHQCVILRGFHFLIASDLEEVSA